MPTRPFCRERPRFDPLRGSCSACNPTFRSVEEDHVARLFQALFAVIALLAFAVAPVTAASAAPSCANAPAMAAMPTMHTASSKPASCKMRGKACLAACAVAATVLDVPTVIGMPARETAGAIVSETHVAALAESRPDLLDRPPRTLS